MRFTILEEIKSTLPKSLFFITIIHKSNQLLVFDERGKPEYPGKNLSRQSRKPTNSNQIWHRVRKSNLGHVGGRQVLSPLGQPCHHHLSNLNRVNETRGNIMNSHHLRIKSTTTLILSWRISCPSHLPTSWPTVRLENRECANRILG